MLMFWYNHYITFLSDWKENAVKNINKINQNKTPILLII